MEDTNDNAISVSHHQKNQRRKKKAKIIKLEEKIAEFDSVLDGIHEVMSEDMPVYDRIVEARDANFRLQQAMRGCQIVEFATSGLDDMIYNACIADIFWNHTSVPLTRTKMYWRWGEYTMRLYHPITFGALEGEIA